MKDVEIALAEVYSVMADAIINRDLEETSRNFRLVRTRAIEDIALVQSMAYTAQETALARQVAMYFIKQETNYSLAQIGKELGDRNPSTVSHACEKIANDINASPHLRRRISDIHQEINPKQKGRSL